MATFVQAVQNTFPFPVPSHRTVALRALHSDIAARASEATDPAISVVVTIGSMQVAALKIRGPVDIRCLSGWLWITTDGDIRDTTLQAGEQHSVLPAARGIVLSAAASGKPVTLEIVPLPCKRRWLPPCTRPAFQLEIA